MDDLAHERQRAEGFGPEPLDEEEVVEAPGVGLLRERHHGPEAAQVGIGVPQVGVAREGHAGDVAQELVGALPRERDDGALRGHGVGVDEVDEQALVVARHGGVGLAHEALEAGGVPVVAAGAPRARGHALLHDRPVARAAHDEGVEVDPEAVLEGGVVDLRRQPARAREPVAVEPGAHPDVNELLTRRRGAP